MSAILPVREKITELSAGLLLHKAIIAPWDLIGISIPWCSVMPAITWMYRMTNKWKGITRFILLGILLLWTFRVEVIDICQCHLFSGRSSYPTKRKQYHPYFPTQPLGLVPTDYTLLLPRKSESRNTGRSNYYISGNQLAAGNLHLSNGTNKKGFFFILAVIHWLFCSFHPCLLFCQNSTCRSLLSMRQAFVLR